VLLTANDVIHSWWVPAFGVKQDAIPGFIRDAWFRVDKEGIYRGNCAELCGRDHGFMPIEVHVLSASKYAEWVQAQKAAMAAEGVGVASGTDAASDASPSAASVPAPASAAVEAAAGKN